MHAPKYPQTFLSTCYKNLQRLRTAGYQSLQHLKDRSLENWPWTPRQCHIAWTLLIYQWHIRGTSWNLDNHTCLHQTIAEITICQAIYSAFRRALRYSVPTYCAINKILMAATHTIPPVTWTIRPFETISFPSSPRPPSNTYLRSIIYSLSPALAWRKLSTTTSTSEDRYSVVQIVPQHFSCTII